MDPTITAGRLRADRHLDPGGTHRRTVSRRTKWIAAAAVVACGAGAAITAGAATPNLATELPAVDVPTVTQFDLTGFIQHADLDAALTGTDPGPGRHGGHLVVNGQRVTIPNNTIVILPANALTWEELFTDSPAPYTGVATGMAMDDTPTPIATYEVNVIGNRVGDQYVAGLVHISQNDLNSGAGYINFIDYDTGADHHTELRVGGTLHNPNCVQAPGDAVAGGPNCDGTRVVLNDPSGRFGFGSQVGALGDHLVGNPDPRFTVDPENPTIASATGFPMCLPRVNADPVAAYLANGNAVNPAVDDPECPLSNRLLAQRADGQQVSMVDAAQIGGLSITTNVPIAGTFANGYVNDPFHQIPMEVGDFVNFAGTVVNDSSTPTAMVSGASTYVSAHTVINNFAAYTKPGQNPAYVSIEVALIGTGGLTVFGAGEAAIRTRFEGMSTDPTRRVHVYGIDLNPTTGGGMDRDWGAIVPDPGPPNGAVEGRWRLRPPCKAAAGAETDRLCSPPPGGNYIPPTREVRAVIENADGTIPPTTDSSPTASNGIVYGQYHAPIGEYIFPENIPGTPIVPNNFETLDFLAQGGYTSGDGTIAGQLDPWPGAAAPAPIVCPSVPTTSVTSYVVPSGGTAVLTGNPGTASANPVLTWTASVGGNPRNDLLTGANTTSPTLSAGGLPDGTVIDLTFSVTNLCGTATANATATVKGAPPVLDAIATQNVITGTSVTLSAHSSSTSLASCAFAQTSGAAVSLTPANPVVPTGVAGNWTCKVTFTAPVTAGTLTFTVTPTNVNGAGPTVNATVNVSANIAVNIAITGAEYRTGKQRLVISATYTGSPTDVLKLMPYTTSTGTTFDPATLGNTLTFGGGVYTITLVGAPPPACNTAYVTPCQASPLKVNAFTANGVTQTGTSGFFGLQRIRT